jgi:hypothetical protein
MTWIAKTVVRIVSLVMAALLALSAAPGARASAPVADHEAHEEIRRTLKWSGTGDHLLELSNVSGSIHVVGYTGRDVEMVAERMIRADSDQALEQAKRDVRLEATEGAQIRICADQERCGCRTSGRGPDRWTFGRWREDRYRVDVNFEMRVASDTRLMLCAINGGRIAVEGTAGDFDVRNVNGPVEMTGVAGSGSAQSVNGSVKVSFVASPKESSSFKTLNGDIVATFPGNLAADLRLKTLNGGLYTDFDVTVLSTSPTAERRNGGFVYRNTQFASVRVGNGGPGLTFEGLNGDIRVLRSR